MADEQDQTPDAPIAPFKEHMNFEQRFPKDYFDPEKAKGTQYEPQVPIPSHEDLDWLGNVKQQGGKGLTQAEPEKPIEPIWARSQILQDLWNQHRAVGQALIDATGIPDAVKAAKGEMTEDEAMTFAATALPGALATPEKAAAKGVEELLPGAEKMIRAYHGSPHDFEKFDLSKIGTGEGAQAYGHGLYFAENPSVAQEYKSALSGKAYQYGTDERLAANTLDTLDDPQAATNFLRNLAAKSQAYPESVRQANAAADLIENGWRPSKGKTYEVAINADPEHFLDWDKPLSEQHPKVQEALQRFGVDPANQQTGQDILSGLYSSARKGKLDPALWAENPHGQVSEKLRDAGIPGIKYLDQGSRASGKLNQMFEEMNSPDLSPKDRATAKAEYEKELAKRTSNYVVFDDKLIDIIKKYGLAGLGIGLSGLAGKQED